MSGIISLVTEGKRSCLILLTWEDTRGAILEEKNDSSLDTESGGSELY
jgi:hypothetical protein